MAEWAGAPLRRNNMMIDCLAIAAFPLCPSGAAVAAEQGDAGYRARATWVHRLSIRPQRLSRRKEKRFFELPGRSLSAGLSGCGARVGAGRSRLRLAALQQRWRSRAAPVSRPEYLREMARQKIHAPPPPPEPAPARRMPRSVRPSTPSSYSESSHNLLRQLGEQTDTIHSIALGIGCQKFGTNRDSDQFARLRRPDVEGALQTSHAYHYGFWVSTKLRGHAAAQGTLRCAMPNRIAICGQGATAESNVVPVLKEDWELRDEVMGYLATCQYAGNRVVEAFGQLDKSFGSMLVSFNRSISRGIIAAAAIQRFGPRASRASPAPSSSRYSVLPIICSSRPCLLPAAAASRITSSSMSSTAPN